ncbi:polyprenol monophosphomannose synthase [bacterium]|nr:polyprenol monophosphomannose synthase [bacterium]
MKNIVIVLPTYNEAENCELFLREVTEAIKNCEQEQDGLYSFKLLVVDDYSPDGTGDIVRRLQNEMPHLHLIQKQKEGLGKAYIAGFKHAMKELDADYVIEMDSDFSHNPKDIRRLVDEIKNGFTFVIGSRYVAGGRIPDNWGYLRVMNSKYGNVFARHIAGISFVRDCTSGFRLLDCELLKKIDLDNLRASGYSFQMNILYEMIKRGAQVKEIPISFVDRTLGKSKLSKRDVIEFMINSFQILFERLTKK